jgi:hypothetical protein
MIETSKVLGGIPSGLRIPLLEAYSEICNNYIEQKWEPSELNGGKLAEIVYTILSDTLSGSNSVSPSKPQNMLKACQMLENFSSTARPGDRSLRILIPRMLPVLYEIRNNRNVGHVGGDVSPNHMDATVVYSMAGWVMGELIRIFHNVSTKEAQAIVDIVAERNCLLVWEVGDKKRVLDAGMPTKDQTLVLLHQSITWVAQKTLASWVDYSGAAMFAKRVLGPLHSERKIEWDVALGQAKISPLGVADVELRLLKSRKQ